MNIAKYFWDLNDRALKSAARILRDPEHPDFALKAVTLLSRCDNPQELFTFMPREDFVQSWPRVRTAWKKSERKSAARDWWETIYEQLVDKDRANFKRLAGASPAVFNVIGRQLRAARIKKGLNQKQLALKTGMKQPDISKIEEGSKNITLFSLIKLCKALDIQRINLAENRQ